MMNNKKLNLKTNRSDCHWWKQATILLLLLLAGSYNASATIRRVNNTPGTTASTVADITFTDLVSAVAAADPEDTIFIEGSPTPYSATVNVAKKLYIIGPGFYLSQNVETQHIKYAAKVGIINFNAGSDGSVLAGVEQIVPMNAAATPVPVVVNTPTDTRFTVDYTNTAADYYPATTVRLGINVSNISIINCRLYMVEINNAAPLQDISIKKCWFSPGVIRSTGTAEVIGLNISNNFFRNDVDQSGTNAGSIRLGNTVAVNISNNTFYNGFKVEVPKTSDVSVINNVFFSYSSAWGWLTVASTSNDYSNNVFNNALGGMTNGTYSNVLAATAVGTWFAEAGGNTLYDAYFLSKVGSPLKYTNNSKDFERGMYGGLSPYIYSGLASVPAVYEIEMPSEVSGNSFNVTVKVKAH